MLVPLTKCLLVLFWLNSCSSIAGNVGVPVHQIQKTHIVTTEDSEPIVLDCDYDAEEYNSSLVVKWLKDEKPIYQWIKGHKPTVYALSKGLIDEEYQISFNPNYRHRAIVFPVPTKEMSGIYKCLMETINATQMIQIYLQVIDVSHLDIQLHSTTLPNDTLVTCAVENVYPEPRLLLWTNDDSTLSKISDRIDAQKNGFFNASSVVSVSGLDANEEIGCTLHFPGTEFNVSKILTSSASNKKLTAAGIIIMLMFLISA